MNYFTIEELTRSATALHWGIDNRPTAQHIQHLEELITHLLDPLRQAWTAHCLKHNLGTPQLCVTSGFRSTQLNQKVGGASHSAHTNGYAADLVPRNRKMKHFKDFCRTWLQDRSFDQFISEQEDLAGTPRWIHLGLRRFDGAQRHQMLSMRGGKYQPLSD